MADPLAVTLHASGTEAASGSGAAVDLARQALDGATQGLDRRGGPRLEALAQGREGGLQARRHRLGPVRDAAAGLLGRGCDPVLQVRGPNRHGLVEARRDAVHPLGEGASALRQPFGDPLGGADEVVAHGAGTGRQGLAGAAGRQRQGSLGIAPAALDRLGDRQAGALDLGAQREALLRQRDGQHPLVLAVALTRDEAAGLQALEQRGQGAGVEPEHAAEVLHRER